MRELYLFWSTAAVASFAVTTFALAASAPENPIKTIAATKTKIVSTFAVFIFFFL